MPQQQPLSIETRDVGLAENRYSTPEDLRYRHEVVWHIRNILSMRKPIPRSKGYRELNKRNMKLLRQVERFEICGIQYAIIDCQSCGHTYLGPMRCESRICDSCARKYGLRIRHKMNELIKNLRPKNGKKLMFLTLTKRTDPFNRPESSDAKKLFRDARKLINSLWPKKLGCGALGVLETGKNYNLHIHLLVYGHYVRQSEISKMWLDLTGDSSIVHIEAVRNPKIGVNYILKYVTKPENNYNPRELAIYLDLLIGVRRIHTYGIFYNYPLAKKIILGCLFCGARLRLRQADPGPLVPGRALFFDEAIKQAALVKMGGNNIN